MLAKSRMRLNCYGIHSNLKSIMPPLQVTFNKVVVAVVMLLIRALSIKVVRVCTYQTRRMRVWFVRA